VTTHFHIVGGTRGLKPSNTGHANQDVQEVRRQVADAYRMAVADCLWLRPEADPAREAYTRAMVGQIMRGETTRVDLPGTTRVMAIVECAEPCGPIVPFRAGVST